MLRSTVVLASILGLIGLATPAWGQDPVVRIEEDWELNVRTPDSEITAPQVITAWGPLASMTGLHATFEINHIASVSFASGGLHLSTWNGDTHLAVVHAGDFASMRTDGEAVRWTQAMEVNNGQLIFEITGGTSTTWGNFGDAGSLRLSLETTLQDLSGYSLLASINNSEVSFAGNRVQDLSMKRIRYIRASGAVTTENTQRYVHQSME
jgi:hypothetical protein